MYLKIKFKSLDRREAIDRATGIMKRYQTRDPDAPQERIEIEVWDGDDLVWSDHRPKN